jgi:excisionase family DNA binding protein
MSEPRLLTVRDAAQAWNVSERYARDLVARGTVRSVRIGRCVRVPREEVDRVTTEGAAVGANRPSKPGEPSG